MSDPSYLTLDVGGIQYNIKRDVLLGFPDSFFGSMLKPEWKESSESIIRIQRDGELFKFVYDYMFYGKLPRNEIGMPLLTDDESLLKEVLEEAKFYHLPGLVAECEEWLCTSEAEQCLKHYADMLDTIDGVLSRYHSVCEVVFKPTGPDSLLALLRSKPYAQAWLRGTLDADSNPNIFMSTTVQHVNVTELLAAALPSPGSETMLNKNENVHDSMEIPASELCDLSEIVNNIDISSLAPSMKLTVKPYKLVVYQEGGHFDGHRDAVRDERHIGTLVLILASECTGGELEVCHGEQKTEVAGALNWVAMFGGCVHTLRPVTSGTLVSLIFDIWNESDEALPTNTNQAVAPMEVEGEANNEEGDLNQEGDENRKEADYYRHQFWPDDEVNTHAWRIKSVSASTSTLTPTVGIDNIWSRIYTALDHELEQLSTVCICLEHLYPTCQADPDFLKRGEDANLFQMLKDKYSLGVTSVTLARSVSRNPVHEYICCREFGSGKMLDGNSVLLVPNAPPCKSILFSLPEDYLESSGRQPEQMVYLLSVLVVRKR